MIKMNETEHTNPAGAGETIKAFLTETQIADRVKELAQLITHDYADKPITLLGTLKGAVFFLADLAREITRHRETAELQLEFIKASSYGSSSVSSGEVKIDFAPKKELTGRHLILVEDIIDMGYTAEELLRYLCDQNPASLALCALLDKPSRRKVSNIKIDYLGFTIPDEFVVGYGLDYAQRYRSLPYIGVLNT